MLLNLQDHEGPLHRRIHDALKAAILAGRLGPGGRLPSTRALAADLGVSRNTVSSAEQGDVHLQSVDGPKLDFITLPYDVPLEREA